MPLLHIPCNMLFLFYFISLFFLYFCYFLYIFFHSFSFFIFHLFFSLHFSFVLISFHFFYLYIYFHFFFIFAFISVFIFVFILILYNLVYSSLLKKEGECDKTYFTTKPILFSYMFSYVTAVQLLSAVPFTPATGSRLLFNENLTKSEVFSLSQGTCSLSFFYFIFIYLFIINVFNYS